MQFINKKTFLSFVALLSIFLAVAGYEWIVYYRFVWSAPATRVIQSKLPENAEGQFESFPFYYAVGLWPKLGKKFYLQVPYFKGPPFQFFEKMEFKEFENSSNSIVVEGPKTPNPTWTREEVWGCFSDAENALYFSEYCRNRREKTIGPSLRALKSQLGLAGYKIQWERFRLEHANLKQKDQTVGLHFWAIKDKKKTERWVLISPKGSHQTLQIEGRLDQEQFWETADTLISSLRLNDDLLPGKDYLDDMISQSNLQAVEKSPLSEKIQQLFQIQEALFSKMSLEPKSSETLFHAAGVTHLLKVALEGAEPKDEMSKRLQDQLEALSKYAKDLGGPGGIPEKIEQLYLHGKSKPNS